MATNCDGRWHGQRGEVREDKRGDRGEGQNEREKGEGKGREGERGRGEGWERSCE